MLARERGEMLRNNVSPLKPKKRLRNTDRMAKTRVSTIGAQQPEVPAKYRPVRRSLLAPVFQ